MTEPGEPVRLPRGVHRHQFHGGSGQTMAERILGAHAGVVCHAGDLVGADLDLVYLTDGSAPAVIKLWRGLGAGGDPGVGDEAMTVPPPPSLFDPSKVVLVIDHYVPAPSAATARCHGLMRDFARQTGCRLVEEGQGVCHQVLGEMGFIRQGELVAGSDSHTVTYGARGAFATGIGSTDAALALAGGRLWLRVPESLRLVLHGSLGPGVGGKDAALYLNRLFGADGAAYCAVEIHAGDSDLSPDDLAAICNTSVEWGAKAAIVADGGRVMEGGGGRYLREITVDLTRIAPVVALPHAVDNLVPVAEAGPVPVSLCIIGTCSGGRLSDLREAAAALRGRTVHPGVRLLVIPASRSILESALREGLVEVFVKAGATMVPPGCGPCCGTGNGVPADGENALSTANRNFRGRMGNAEANVFLASPATVAASARAGRLVDPRKEA